MTDGISSICRRIFTYDESLCSEHFLGELAAMLPEPAVIGKLSQHRTDDEAVLVTLAAADRFLVQLMKIDHLRDRIKGMLYRTSFAETYTTLSHNATNIYEASEAMQKAKNFGQLLRLMLVVGNFMNGTGYNGGAFGFKITSINRVSIFILILQLTDFSLMYPIPARRH